MPAWSEDPPSLVAAMNYVYSPPVTKPVAR